MYLPVLLFLLMLASTAWAAEKKTAPSTASTSQLPFTALCLNPKISVETAYTLAKLIHASRYEFPTKQFPEDAFREATRKNANELIRKLPPETVHSIASHLEQKTYLSLQAEGITDLRPLAGLKNLITLGLNGNSASNLSPLANLNSLEQLHLSANQLADLSPLTNLVNLQKLTLTDNPLTSLQILGRLPKLAELEISAGHVHLLAGSERLDALRKLTTHGVGPCSFIATPLCPALVSLDASGLTTLDGIEKFPALLNADLTGVFTSLKPLTNCPHLTHLTLSPTRTLDAAELADLPQIKAIHFRSSQVKNLESLGSHKTLREVTMPKSKGDSALRLKLLHASLSSWDADFLLPRPRHTPSPKLQIVPQEEFDRYESKESYGVGPQDKNLELIESERTWLESRLSKTLAVKWNKESDWEFPYTSGLHRVHVLYLSSLKAHQAVPQMVALVQKELSTAKNDWLIFLESELLYGPDSEKVNTDATRFYALIYPDKIVTTEKYANTIRKLFKP